MGLPEDNDKTKEQLLAELQKLRDQLRFIQSGNLSRPSEVEEALQSEERLRFAHQCAGAGSWNWDLRTNEVLWSKEYRDLHGLDQNAPASYENWIARIHPEDRPSVEAEVRRMFQERLADFRKEFRILHPTKGVRWIADLGKVIFDAGGSLVRASGINIDITREKEAEAVLKKGEERLRRLDRILLRLARSRAAAGDGLKAAGQEIMEAAAEALDVERASIWLYNEDRSAIHCHDLYERSKRRHLAGMTLEAAQYRDYFKALELERIIPAHTARTDPRTRAFSESYLCPLGITSMLDAPIWLHGKMVGVVCHEQVGPERKWVFEEQSFAASISDFVSLAMEAAERKRTEEALGRLTDQIHEQANALEGILSASVDHLYLLDKNGRYKYVSSGAAGVLGLTPVDVVGKSWRDLGLPSDVMEHFDSERKKVMSTGLPLRSESSFGLRHYEYITAPVRDKEGKIEGVVVVSRDITDHRDADSELRRAKKSAEEANRAKDEFLAIVSHELRTPLNAILGWSQLLRYRMLDEETAVGAVESIERNARGQAQLIDDLLDVSRIITGKLRLDISPLSLPSVIEAALDSVRPTAEAKEIQIISLLDPLSGVVWGDADRLKQVVWNLLSNAIKFTPKGGRVEIDLTQVGSNARIRVIDTGIGIHPDFLPYVFDRFYQAESVNTRSNGGLGLGLAIVRHLMELHGGSVEADSRGEGQGAVFTVTLPVRSVSSENEDLRKGLSFDSALSLGDSLKFDRALDSLQILVVDDDADSLVFMRTVFECCGARVVTAVSVEEALQRLEEFQPDVLLSDIAMPGQNGYALIEKVKELERKKRIQIPAAALTANAREEDHRQALAAGFQMHISKPIEPEKLVALVAALTGRTHRTDLKTIEEETVQ